MLQSYTLGDLLQDIRNGRTIQDMLDACDNPPNRGHLLDALARCAVAFRASPEFEGARLLVGNSNKSLRIVQNVRNDFLDVLVNNSCGNGTSDVSYTIHNNLYLSSSKYFEKVKSIDDYDISGLVQLWDSMYKHQYNEHRVVLFVRDKDEFITMAQRANKFHLNKFAHVFGITEMEKMVCVIRDVLRNNDPEDYMRIMTNTVRIPLRLIFHQQIILGRTLECQDNRIRLGKCPQVIIWGALPRSGKSYLTAGHILRSIERGMRAFMLITPIPNETIHQFKDDLFDRVTGFADVDIVVGSKITEHVKAYQEAIAEGKPVRPFVAMMSKQLDHAASRNDPEKLGVAGDFSFDTIYYDEGHCGGSTELSLQMFESYTNSENTQLILMTATYHKPHYVLGVPSENIILWDLDALEAARNGDMETLRSIYGTTHLDATNTTPEELRATYSHEPRMCIMSAYHRPSLVERFRAIHGEKTSILGADIDRIYDLNCDFKFSNQSAVRSMIGMLLGNGNETNAMLSVMDQIRDHANLNSGRGGSEGLSQMWFLPYGQGRQIEHVLREMKILLESHLEGKKYHVVNLNDCTGDLRAFVTNEEAISRSLGKKGTIILTGERASMGISLPKVDIVVLLTHTSSADNVYQKIWRSMTRDEGKKYGYVVDMDAHRVLNTLLIYDSNSRNSANLTIRERIVRLSKIVDLVDALCINMNREDIIQELHNIWQADMHTRRNIFEHRLRDIGLVFDEETVKKLGALLGASSRRITTNKTIEVNEKNRKLPQSTYNTHSILVDNSDTDEESLTDDLDTLSLLEEEEEEYDISDLLPTVVNLATILTFNKIGPEWADIRGTIQGIYDDPFLCIAFEEQCLIYWNINNIQQFKSILMDGIQKMNPVINKDIKEVIECIREYMVALSLNKKKELIEYLQSILTPREVEKKKYGEVFTPLTLVEQMLDQLPVDVWLDPSLKWFDPAVGVGNFMVCVYYRLMISLSGIIEDELERRRHIITEMLYMSELNHKNTHICHLIFGEDANIHQGDTLQLDITGKWNIEKFDIIVGNPPYQPMSNGKKGGKSLWPSFVKYAFDVIRDDGYLCFVHPSLWRKPNNELHDLMFGKQFHYLSLHTKQEGDKVFKSTTRYDWYVLQNTPSVRSCTVRFDDGEMLQIQIEPKLPYLPNHGFSILEKTYVVAIRDGCLKTLQSSECHTMRSYVSKKQEGEFVHILLNSVSRTRGKQFAFSSKPHTDQYKKKVIFSNGEIIQPFYDKGELGVTQGAIYVLVESDEEGEKVVKFLNSRLVSYIIAATKWSNFETVKQVFWMLPHPKMLSSDFTDTDIYNYIGLTETEIARL